MKLYKSKIVYLGLALLAYGFSVFAGQEPEGSPTASLLDNEQTSTTTSIDDIGQWLLSNDLINESELNDYKAKYSDTSLTIEDQQFLDNLALALKQEEISDFYGLEILQKRPFNGHLMWVQNGALVVAAGAGFIGIFALAGTCLSLLSLIPSPHCPTDAPQFEYEYCQTQYGVKFGPMHYNECPVGARTVTGPDDFCFSSDGYNHEVNITPAEWHHNNKVVAGLLGGFGLSAMSCFITSCASAAMAVTGYYLERFIDNRREMKTLNTIQNETNLAKNPLVVRAVQELIDRAKKSRAISQVCDQ